MPHLADPQGAIGDWDFNQRTAGPGWLEKFAQARQLGGTMAGSSLAATVDLIPGPKKETVASFQELMLGDDTGPTQADITAIVTATNAQISAMQVQATVEISAAQALGGSSDDFVAKMEASKAAAIQQTNDAIDAAYAKLNAMGTAYPDTQPLIVQAVGEIGALASSAVSTLESAFDGPINAVESAAEAVAAAAVAAANAIADAAKTVESGIEKIFSGW